MDTVVDTTEAAEPPPPSGRHRLRLALVAIAVAVVLLVSAGLILHVLISGSGAQSGADVPYPGTAPGRSAAAGWRLESSLGLEIEVPADWATNNSGCGQTDASSVVRGKGVETMCLTPEPENKQVAELLRLTDPLPPLGSPDQVTVDGVPALRGEGRLADGRYAGTITFPDRDIGLSVRTADQATTAHILDSLHVVDVDHLGCATAAPAPGHPQPAGGNTLVPARPTEIDVCFYAHDPLLQASTAITGAAAAALATGLNAARHGNNPDLTCDDYNDKLGPDAVLLVRADGATTVVFVTANACTGRGLSNGTRTAQLTETLLHLILRPLHSGYAFAELPAS